VRRSSGGPPPASAAYAPAPSGRGQRAAARGPAQPALHVHAAARPAGRQRARAGQKPGPADAKSWRSTRPGPPQGR